MPIGQPDPNLTNGEGRWPGNGGRQSCTDNARFCREPGEPALWPLPRKRFVQAFTTFRGNARVPRIGLPAPQAQAFGEFPGLGSQLSVRITGVTDRARLERQRRRFRYRPADSARRCGDDEELPRREQRVVPSSI